MAQLTIANAAIDFNNADINSRVVVKGKYMPDTPADATTVASDFAITITIVDNRQPPGTPPVTITMAPTSVKA